MWTKLNSSCVKMGKFSKQLTHNELSSGYYYTRASIATDLSNYSNIVAVIPILTVRSPGIDAVHTVSYENYTLSNGYFSGGNLAVSSNRSGTSTVMVYVLYI